MNVGIAARAAHDGWIRSRPAPGPAAGLVYGGFWVRAAAWILDALAIGAIAGALDGLIGFGRVVTLDGERVWSAGGTGLLVSLVYLVGFWIYSGQTPGMIPFGLRVVRAEDGTKLDVSRAILRYVGLGIALIVLFLGVIWVGIDQRKQGWHDKIANTLVVRPT